MGTRGVWSPCLSGLPSEVGGSRGNVTVVAATGPPTTASGDVARKEVTATRAICVCADGVADSHGRRCRVGCPRSRVTGKKKKTTKRRYRCKESQVVVRVHREAL